MVTKIIRWIKEVRASDPVYNCEVHRAVECSHIDGPLCEMETCGIRAANLAGQVTDAG